MGYSVGEVAERTGFTVETLRYYERIELVSDVPRDSGGRRIYGDEHLAWLDMLQCLRDTGMPIREMTKYAHLSRQAGSAQALLDVLRTHAQEVDERIELLRRQRAHVAEKIAWYESQPDTE